ncbi:Drn1p KNAG_0B01120 [Huiozyma naganishii CBS 8797]|uniref:Cwf19-like C-terminal domain-containing protein n=1 Tax=Huiozyma naganishii (strain ATCC MYA-139 / BCRC 22969 / CBS 8797 / KCTC 17520 / NBRC 10181 / NCYC 3082 / Yp74L-3) TaxID=1071383 RepID=J7S383_HUIN7|nr:hypothetical protein KNAG_0B01120 [Kazachstania naganishii CBS 8797]CCK68559.1 hypothetical protein KNAG_0B01120 [Kazachstania naganishii CBS 8797]
MKALEKIAKATKKSGPFHCCFVLGNEKYHDELADYEQDKLPPVFAFNSSFSLSPEHSGSETINDKIQYLNGCGIYQTTGGLTIAYVTYMSNELSQYKNAILQKFRKIEEGIVVDILVTNEWSEAISHEQCDTLGSPVIDEIVKLLEPRYHFSSSKKGKFVELNPFQWADSGYTSRFINLSELGSNEKWAYAFQVCPSTLQESENLPSNLASNPYLPSNKKRHFDEGETLPAKSSVDTNGTKKMKTVLPENCHFCFSNQSLQDHMIITIDEKVYVTIARGPLTIPSGEMYFSGHCLIIPIKHVPKMITGEESHDIESELFTDMLQCQESIVRMNYVNFDMSTIVFEINSERSIHFHKQVLPIPKHHILRFQNALKKQADFNNEKLDRNAKLEFRQFVSPSDSEYTAVVHDPKSNYMQFTVYETSTSPPIIHLATFDSESRIDLQFGRRVVAYLLHLTKRIKWDSPACLQSIEQETKEAELFQKAYKDFEVRHDL